MSRKFRKENFGIPRYLSKLQKRDLFENALNRSESLGIQTIQMNRIRRIQDYFWEFVDYLKADINSEEVPPIYLSQRNDSNSKSTPKVSCQRNTIFPLSIHFPQEDILNGDSIGEEVGHSIREILRNQKGYKYSDEHSVSEFLGYLGRRIFKKIKGEQTELKFEDGSEYSSLTERLGLLKEIKELKKDFQNLVNYYSYRLKLLENPKNLLQKIAVFSEFYLLYGKEAKNKIKEEKKSLNDSLNSSKDSLKELKETYQDVITHCRGYYLATQIDLDKVNLLEVYSLPQEEITRRFFGKEKIYALPEKTLEQKVENQ